MNHPSLSDSGLFRTRLASGPARTTEAFRALREAPWRIDDAPGGRSGIYGGRLQVSEDPQEGEWEMISLGDDIYVNTSSCYYRTARTETVRSERFIEFHFVLTGETRVQVSEFSDVRIGPPTLSIVQQGEGSEYTVACGPGPWRSVGLHVTREFFGRFLRASVDDGNPLLQVFDEGASSPHLYCAQMPLCAIALQAVEQLLANPYQGYRRLLYAEAKVKEILCASVDLWFAHVGNSDGREVCSPRERRLIASARDLLLADPAAVPTIPKLAAAVGLNTSKLKRGFKQVYGCTVFEMGHRFRMQHALQLLVEEKLPVSEVALAVGYGYQTSFTVAFRDFFGVVPKEARRLVADAAGKVPLSTATGPNRMHKAEPSPSMDR